MKTEQSEGEWGNSKERKGDTKNKEYQTVREWEGIGENGDGGKKIERNKLRERE